LCLNVEKHRRQHRVFKNEPDYPGCEFKRSRKDAKFSRTVTV
jgi:hypothetical protein